MEKLIITAALTGNRDLGREISAPDETRRILGLKGRDKVNY